MFLKEMLLSNLLTCVLHFTSGNGSETIVFEEKYCGNELPLSSFALGYSRNNQTGKKGGGSSLRTQLLFEIKAWNFKFFCFAPGNSGQNKASLLEILQNCVTLLENSENKNQEPWKFHMIFSWSPLEIPLRF